MTILEQAETLRQQGLALLIAERDTINQKIAQMGGEERTAIVIKSRTCSKCGGSGHTARTCKATPSETNG